MSRPTVLLDLASDNRLAKDLAAGGVFVPGCTLKLDQDCDLIVRALDDHVLVAARVVFVDPQRGAGLELVRCSAETKQKIAALAATVGISAPTMSGDLLGTAAAAARVRAGRDKLPGPTITGDELAARASVARANASGTARAGSGTTPTPTITGDALAARAAAARANVESTPTPTITGDALAERAAAARRSAEPTPTITGDALAERAAAARANAEPSPDGAPRAKVPTAAPIVEQADAESNRGSGRVHERTIATTGRAKVISGAHPAIPTDARDENRTATVRPPIVAGRAKVISGSHPQIPRDEERTPTVRPPQVAAGRAKVISGTHPTITGDALAAAAAEALATAEPHARPRQATGSPTITGDALAAAAAAANAAAAAIPQHRHKEVTGPPTMTGDALAEAAQRAARLRESTGAPTITGDALAAAAAAAREAAQREPQPTITGDALAAAAAAALQASEGAERSETDAESDDSQSHATEQADADEDIEAVRNILQSVHERLRHLTLAQQVKLAHHGELPERIILERMYGKHVWEPLLRNPRLTGQEVARISRMGALPRTLIEIIVGNGTWLQIPEVRRALLANHRLSPDQILRVLRLLPKHELKLAATQTAYSFAVRDAARHLIRGE